MMHQRLEAFIERNHCTLLGVGPMSVNCVNAVIELANDYEVPIILIASRRQIDSEEFGGGYVNNWTTDQFANYVIDRDRKGKVILARDHGGIWQNEKEKTMGLSFRRAMESAKSSFKADIEAGFQVLHIDPSVDIHGSPSVDEVLERIYELYEYCWAEVQKRGQDIIFEIGTDEQTGSINTQEELEYTVKNMQSFCKRNNLPLPSFVVIQTGTRVMETRNVGSFDSPVRIAHELPAEIQVPKIIEICNRYGIFVKAHNVDYLSDEALQWHPRLEIHSANVAPEFGVTETRTFINVLEENGMEDLLEQFMSLALDSGKWEKWMLPGTKATDRDRAIIAGHYVFSTEACEEIKREVRARLNGIDLDERLKANVKASIMRYMKKFRLLRHV